MRGSPNRQTVSTTARWNLVQSDPNSVGAQKKPVKNQQTGQGTNVDQLKRSLAAAELHLSQTYDPRTIQLMKKGIDRIKAQLARASGNDPNAFDVTTIEATSTGYEFAGNPDSTDFSSTHIVQSGHAQSKISPFAAFQLAGTLRQQITKVVPHLSVTPAGFQKYTENPQARSNVIRTPNNPGGSTFPTGKHDFSNLPVSQDTRADKGARKYLQGFTPGTHGIDLAYTGAGNVPSYQDGTVARGKHGQYKGGYQFGGFEQ